MRRTKYKNLMNKMVEFSSEDLITNNIEPDRKARIESFNRYRNKRDSKTQ